MPKEDLLAQADALIRRRRAGKKEDLPVLTDQVGAEKFKINPAILQQSLASLPPEVSKIVEDWLTSYLPQAVERQMEDFIKRISQDMEAALRNHLMGQVRERLKDIERRG